MAPPAADFIDADPVRSAPVAAFAGLGHIMPLHPAYPRVVLAEHRGSIYDAQKHHHGLEKAG